ncbi:hypothetical protein [Carnobacterium maltaromaticum]|uniref:hypothetical protein n=1 Tax=Carnobacterium maltaromaticum TaxID=2751 RepID=UPI00191BB098|nr:hypothetical protein [Carnobacterium maltaromaticum]CAD5902685.1 exported hypothetical protein [Carnobacterium maltaromaticum]
MNRKALVFLTTVLVIVLSACGANGKEQKEALKNNPQDFIELTEVYFEKQQALMMKQAEGQSGEFAELNQHAQDVIESDEYKEWEKEVKKVESFNFEKKSSSVEFIELQTALNDYGKVQIEYFQELAKAEDVDVYNEVNADFAEQLEETQDKFILIMETIEY